MQTYTANYRWTKDVLYHAMQRHNRTVLGRGVTLLVTIVMVLLLAASLFVIAVGKNPADTAVSIFPLLLLSCFWLFWRPWEAKWLSGLTFGKRTDANALVEWEISEETIRIQTERLSSSEFRWQLLTKVVETPDGFLFYPQPKLFHWFPFSAFEKPESVEQVRQLAKASGVKYTVSKG